MVQQDADHGHIPRCGESLDRGLFDVRDAVLAQRCQQRIEQIRISPPCTHKITKNLDGSRIVDASQGCRGRAGHRAIFIFKRAREAIDRRRDTLGVEGGEGAAEAAKGFRRIAP